MGEDDVVVRLDVVELEEEDELAAGPPSCVTAKAGSSRLTLTFGEPTTSTRCFSGPVENCAKVPGVSVTGPDWSSAEVSE